jgi:hypothetical protein
MQPTFIDALIHYAGIFVVLAILIRVAWNLRMHYINKKYLDSIPYVLLEVIPPKEVFKSPAAMELVLSALYGGDQTNWFKKYWDGELHQVFSLEIASIEGSIHFYIRFDKKFRKGFESQLYAQYPQAVVREVEDYAQRVPEYTKDGPIKLFGIAMKLEKPDPIPIKTYIDFGLDRAIGSLEEAERIDPITPILEVMGSIGVGEQIWLQILMHKEQKRHEVKSDKGEVEAGKSAKDKAREVIRQEREKLKIKDAEGKVVTVDRATKGQQYVIEAIERNMNKPSFDCGMRVLYIADKEHFSGASIGAFTSMFRHFISEDLNTLKIGTITRPPDEPWKDIGLRKMEKKKRLMLQDYKDRDYFYGGFKFNKLERYFKSPVELGDKPMLLSVEELATIWHLPGRVAETPTFGRIEATKSEPPANLPI